MTETTLQAELEAAEVVADIIQYWGFRRPLARVWTVLYLEGGALPAVDLCRVLHMSAGAFSAAANELERWGVIRRVSRPGERREYFEAETDFWKMIARVVGDRERRLAVNARNRLESAAGLLRQARARDDQAVRGRLEKLARLAAIAVTITDAFVASQQADFSPLQNVIALARRARPS